MKDLLDNKNQEKIKSYYDVHVNHGKHGYSIAVVCPYPMEDQRIIDKAIEEDLFEDKYDDLHVDYINELTFDEWNTHFNI